MHSSSFVLLKSLQCLFVSVVFLLLGCGGSSSTAPISTVNKDAPDNYNCTAHWEPVCGKAKMPINCVMEPCPEHEYSTFSNSCYAINEGAITAFNDECIGLEGKLAFSDNPVKIKELSSIPVDNFPFEIRNIKFVQDVVHLEISYAGGCEPHEFSLFVSNIFMESNPVKTTSSLSHFTMDTCEALITETISFDLLPLKEFYRRAYGEESGSIYIEGIGLYTF